VRDAAKFSWERTASETLAVYTELTSPMAARAPDRVGYAK